MLSNITSENDGLRPSSKARPAAGESLGEGQDFMSDMVEG